MDLLETVLRAQALESLLTREAPASHEDAPAPGRPLAGRPLIPALPAAASLRPGTDGRGDLFSLRVGSPCAALAFGATPEVLLRQALGRGTAPAYGRDAGTLPTDWERGWVGPVPLPGALVEVMAGIAMALRLRGEPRVALLVDDTAGSGSGDWHEGLNLAVVQRAPLVLVNHDLPRPAEELRAAPMAERAEGYGFPVRETVDSDPWGVLEACRAAVAAARAGEGVQVVDVRADPDAGPDDLVAALRSEGVDDEAVHRIREEALAEMAAALERVEAEPAPDPGAVLASASTPGVSDLHRVRTPRPWS